MSYRFLVGMLWLLGVVPFAAAQPPSWQDHPLTLTTAIARFEGSPFAANDQFIEIGEWWAGEWTLYLPLWGANAPVYPSWAGAVSWGGDWLGFNYAERTGTEAWLAYHVPTAHTLQVIPAEAGYQQISPLSWAGNRQTGVFSAKMETGFHQIYQVRLADSHLETLAEGRLPVWMADDSQILYLNAYDHLAVLHVETGEIQTFAGRHPRVSSLAVSPDGEWVALTQGATLTVIELATNLPYQVFDATTHLGVAAGVVLGSAAWSPHSQQVAVILNYDMGAHGISQVVEVQPQTRMTRIIAERNFSPATFPDDPRIFIGVSYQRVGAFPPPREDSDGV